MKKTKHGVHNKINERSTDDGDNYMIATTCKAHMLQVMSKLLYRACIKVNRHTEFDFSLKLIAVPSDIIQ